MAARTAAEKGLKVLLVERKLEIGVPDKCGEYLPSIGEMRRLAPRVVGLEGLFDPPSSCIVNHTKYVRFVFPNEMEISVPFRGLVVERKLFDKHLANEAARAGAEILVFTRVVDILEDGCGVRVKNLEGVKEIRGRTIVAADGAYSLVARRADLPVSRDPLDYGVGFQYEMVNVDHDPEYVDMYISENIAPGAYAWIIPKGEDVANVGTAVRTPYMRSGLTIRDYQRNFVEKHPPSSLKLRRAMPTAVKAGLIPVGGAMTRTSVGNVVAVGDAAGHTIPTVGGGIPPALICGRIAGQVIAEHIFDGRPLTDFDEAWRTQMGEVLENSLRMRRMSDITFKNERVINLVTRRGWLTEETVMKFVLCQMDAKMRLMERTLGLIGRL
jgi:digeranylgeranylglycerophospholipid reductase